MVFREKCTSCVLRLRHYLIFLLLLQPLAKKTQLSPSQYFRNFPHFNRCLRPAISHLLARLRQRIRIDRLDCQTFRRQLFISGCEFHLSPITKGQMSGHTTARWRSKHPWTCSTASANYELMPRNNGLYHSTPNHSRCGHRHYQLSGADPLRLTDWRKWRAQVPVWRCRCFSRSYPHKWCRRHRSCAARSSRGPRLSSCVIPSLRRVIHVARLECSIYRAVRSSIRGGD